MFFFFQNRHLGVKLLLGPGVAVLTALRSLTFTRVAPLLALLHRRTRQRSAHTGKHTYSDPSKLNAKKQPGLRRSCDPWAKAQCDPFLLQWPLESVSWIQEPVL
ncbi:hypothetical protein F7725_013761 [Dissostichus mawsoni]|uniref:Uncharacterized protein n=1 Tax=Dissostichus mawsoni TaxID=36200 RepID=A0A7J5YV39_DISMA|nr:hypothetical protein F7725_013761 [Dissostichus mawsoni]